ncbi:MAG: alpha/beta fold hydrolase [Acidimicrobiia bacterium]
MARDTPTGHEEHSPPDRITRKQAAAMRAAGVGLNSLSYVAPGIAGRAATYLWFTPFPFAKAEAPRIPPGAHRVSFGSGELVVHGYEIGDGPRTALLVHGWAGSSRQYRRMAERLVAEGYRSIVLDLPAHGLGAGGSTDVPEVAEAIEIAGDALDTIDMVVAHSLGAMSASLAMQGSLRAERLVLIAPALRPHQVLESFAANLQLRPVVANAVEDAMEARFGADIWDRIPNEILTMDAPDGTLIIQDLEDDMVPIEDTRLLAERLGAPLVTTEGHGHNGVLRASEAIDEVTTLAVAGSGSLASSPV